MELSKMERELLNLLAGEWEQMGPPGFVETKTIARKLNISVSDAKATIHSLFVKGLVDTDEVETFAAYLTPEGYEQARSDH